MVAFQNNSRKKLNNLRKKLKTQDKNSRFRRSLKRCLPKTRQKKLDVSTQLFRAEYKPRGYYLEHFWQADLGYIWQALIRVKVPNSNLVACVQHGRVLGEEVPVENP